MVTHNLEHTCDECGMEKPGITCLCERDLRDKLDAAFEDGKKEGYDEGFEKAKEELAHD